MPKMKTHRGAAKRFKVTGSGKVKFKRNGLRHILTSKSAKRKRALRRPDILTGADAENIKKLLPYA
ncbi:50S ribosomal protein L35 [Deferribacteraceae bacterium V6Fe1]|jgi:large subunit ribosomal protein L35|uniref:50S ribosomal protein L35 n=1 Tax=Deferrivibrio essentukiensis TaxID=2880922 RepID=UPI001F624997|nr:50S ribosomal protein L35 [Deferrivibrio essentukiensis]MCB4204729.1 50S ribosomal protein L35 [Deferrivibrio essentukiensis]UOD34045.1 50S ribosomal protein L35 [Deferribacteraceae bacterium V6Fe1]